MRSKKNGRTLSQRQLRVGEMIKQALGNIFMRGEAKLPNIETNNITVTEVRMSPDLKTAKAFVLPLGGKNACLLYTSPSPRDKRQSRMPSSA